MCSDKVLKKHTVIVCFCFKFQPLNGIMLRLCDFLLRRVYKATAESVLGRDSFGFEGGASFGFAVTVQSRLRGALVSLCASLSVWSAGA